MLISYFPIRTSTDNIRDIHSSQQRPQSSLTTIRWECALPNHLEDVKLINWRSAHEWDKIKTKNFIYIYTYSHHMIPADGHGLTRPRTNCNVSTHRTIHNRIVKSRILGLINQNDLDLREQQNNEVLILNNDMTWKAHASTLFCKNWPDRGSGRLMTHFYALCCLHHHRWLH